MGKYLNILEQPTSKNKLKVKLFWKDWVKFLAAHVEQNNHFIIVGDLNFHLDIPDNSYTIKFNSLLAEFGLQQLINEPTHIHGHTLDILVTTSENCPVTSHHVSDLGFINDSGELVKDHFAIKWMLKGERKKFQAETRKVRKWSDMDIHVFKQDLKDHLNVQILDNIHSSSLVDWYNSTLSSLVDKHAPEKTVIIRRAPNPWYNDDIRDHKRKRRRLERIWKKTKLTVDHQIYRTECVVFNNKIRIAKLIYNKTLVSNCGRDQKKIFSVANKLLGKQSTNVYPREESDEQCANNFIQFFTKKVVKIHSELTDQRNELLAQHPDILNQMTNEPTSHQLQEFEQTSNPEIKNIVVALANKQCELDPLPTWLLKSIIDMIAPTITKIVNISLSTATMPSSLKTAIVRPILKKPSLDSEDYSNFRPVSNLPVLGKIIEKVVYTRLNNYINDNNLYGKNQSAYRKYHSTETALLKVQNDILLALDKGKCVALVMIDVSAAFDTVEHHSLLSRFKYDFGLRDKALQWFNSYLTNREHKVAINSSYSEFADIEYGFAQGATLAGLCFNCYSAPLDNIAENFNPVNQHNYADDGQSYIAFACKDQEQAMVTLQNCLEKTRRWMILNHLKVNDDKTKVIFFSPKKTLNPAMNIKFGSEIVKPSACVKNLGVKMDNLMSMEKHINKITKSAYFHIRNISKIRKCLDNDTTKTLVQAFVISRIDYCNSLLINLPQKLLKKVQRAQNSAARLVAKVPKRTHITPVLKDLHWLPVTARITFKVLLQTYKCVNGFAPMYLKELLSTTRTLRSNAHACTLQIRRYQKKKHGSRAFKVAAPSLWNSIPENIRNAKSIAQFKSLLKTHLFIEHYTNRNNNNR